MDTFKFNLIVLSHPFDIKWGALAWVALKRKILMIQPFGAYGTLRFVKMYEPSVFSTFDHPTKMDFNKLLIKKQKNLIFNGRKILQKRLNGSLLILQAMCL